MNLANTFHFINPFQLFQVANNFVVFNQNSQNFILKKIQIPYLGIIFSKIVQRYHVAELQTPLTGLENHIAELQTPLTGMEDHIVELQTPLTGLEDHVAELQTPLTGMEDHVAELQTPLP